MGSTFEKSMETLSVVAWIFCSLIWPPIVYPFLIFSIVYLPSKWSVISLLVLISCISWIFVFDKDTIHKGGRRCLYVQKLSLWKRFNQYFPIKVVTSSECNLDPRKNYLFCNHPHGLLCFGAYGAFATSGNPDKEKLFHQFKFSLITFNQSFMFPLLREITLAMGCCSSSRESMNYILSQEGGGNVGILIPGGAPETLDFCPGKYILHLKKRRGFVKVALQNGAPLVPVFSFGENVVFSQFHNEKGTLVRWVQDWIQGIINIPPVLWYGRGFSRHSIGLFPRRIPITIVVGTPIPVKKVTTPSQAQIDELHEKYVQSLTKLFYENRHKYSQDPNDTLVII